MKTIRMTEHWQERDSGQGSVSNPSHHSNNNSNGNLHAQQAGNSIPVEVASTSVGSPGHLERLTANAAVVLAGGCASVNKVTVNQVAIHQQAAQEASQDGQLCTRKLKGSIRTLDTFIYYFRFALRNEYKHKCNLFSLCISANLTYISSTNVGISDRLNLLLSLFWK